VLGFTGHIGFNSTPFPESCPERRGPWARRRSA